ncbi:MAG: hypothetical protein Q8O95_02010 [bacterium]|nr:hypothetical protein [bacterium]
MVKVVRPWQGTVLGYLAAIGTAIAAIGGVLALFGQGMMFGLMGGMLQGAPGMDPLVAGGVTGMLQGMFWVFALILIGIAVFSFFMTRGLFAGARWALIVVLVFSVLGLLQSLSMGEVVGIAINAFVVYLGVSVWKDPFYNQKG